MTFPPHLRRSHGKQRRLLALMVVASRFAAACSGSDTETTAEPAEAGSDTSETNSSETESSEAAAPSGDVLAAGVFDAEALTVDGQEFDLAQLADSDLVLWFWAPW